MNFKRESFGLSSFVIVVETELNALKSNKHIIYSSLLTPILYYVFYAIGIQSTFGDIYFHGQYMSFLSFAFAGILIMCLFQQMDQSVYRLVIDKRWNILPIKLESGINPECYVLGISTLPFVVTLLQLIILLAISMITGMRISLWQVIGMFLLLCIFIVFWTSIFSCIALLINDYKQRDFILGVVMTPLIFAAPLFYSLDNAPMILQVISKCNPLTYQLELIRDVMIGYFDWGLLVFFLIISIIALLFSGSALKRVDYTNEEH